MAVRFAVAMIVTVGAGCDGSSPPLPGSGPAVPANASDALDCRFQARRQAEMRYPRHPIDDAGTGTRRARPVPEDPGKIEAEQRFFRQCKRQKAAIQP